MVDQTDKDQERETLECNPDLIMRINYSFVAPCKSECMRK